MTNQNNGRPLRYETLETRCVLSASGLGVEFADADQAYYTAESPDTNSAQVISHLKVQVNNDVLEINPQNTLLNLSAGDHVSVLEIGYLSDKATGAFAAEGYVSKIHDTTSASLIDYNDGRFSLREDNPTANGTGGIIGGLDGEWIVEEGWDRLTINLMHYSEKGVSVDDRLFVNLQVGLPDLAFDTEVFDEFAKQRFEVGDKLEVPVSWMNKGEGIYHNYAELDVYNVENMEQIIWAGASVGNANTVEGIFINDRGGDMFDALFVPQQEGEYVLKFYIDPERAVNEYNEDNNEYEVRIKVYPANEGPVANDDHFKGIETVTGNVLANDSDPENDALNVNDFEQPENGTVKVDENGKFHYVADQGFEGKDHFSYTVTDGNSTDVANVYLNVLDSGIEVTPTVAGLEDEPLTLFISLDTNRFDSAIVAGIPEGASIEGSTRIDNNTVVVSAENGPEYKLLPVNHSDVNFTLTVTPANSELQTTGTHIETIDVHLTPVLDGGKIRITNFGIATGNSGPMPMKFNFPDNDGSEQHTLTLFGIPEFISFSAGTRSGDSWSFSGDELSNLQISADRVSLQRTRYDIFEIGYESTSTEIDSGETRTGSSAFRLYVWHR